MTISGYEMTTAFCLLEILEEFSRNLLLKEDYLEFICL